MSDERDASSSPRHQPLPVLPSSGKVEKLREEERRVREGQATATPAAESAGASATDAASVPAAKHCDTTLVSRFADSSKTPAQKAIEEKIVSVLRTIYDPEIPVNIYDLGLIYSIDVDAATSKVRVKMTLTAPGCPVAGELVAEVGRKVEALDEVPDATVELVWDPPWDRERMSESARLELGLL